MLPRVLAAFLALLPLALGATTAPAPARCTNPSVRREWRSFSSAEKADWIRSVKCLASLPHTPALTPEVPLNISGMPPVNTSSTYYDDFVYMHMDLNTKIHFTGLFLPWHRWYVYVYETALKTKCGYKGVSPYWDWTLDAPNFHDSAFFKETSPTSGLGGWGLPSDDVQVQDGGFGVHSSFKLAYPVPHSLRRNFTLRPYEGINSPFFPDQTQEANTSFTLSEVNKMVNGFVGDYKGFQSYFEGFQGAHGGVHLITGGDLGGQCPAGSPSTCVPGPTWSPNEPLFWMHHAMVDKVWYDWQHKSPQNKGIFFGGASEEIDSVADYDQFPNGGAPFLNLSSVMPADGLFPAATIGSVIDTTSGILCYVYDS